MTYNVFGGTLNLAQHQQIHALQMYMLLGYITCTEMGALHKTAELFVSLFGGRLTCAQGRSLILDRVFASQREGEHF